MRSDGTFSRADFVFDLESATSISVRVESCCLPPEQSSTAVRFAIVPQRSIATSVRSRCVVVPARRCDMSLAICTRMPAMSPAPWPRPRLTNNRVGSAKKVEMRFAHMKRIFKLDRLATARPERR